tara:strand:- start:713 stop:883 length:171 start_codon:yes stop_codon:yes gene_type:complete
VTAARNTGAASPTKGFIFAPKSLKLLLATVLIATTGMVVTRRARDVVVLLNAEIAF